MSSASEETMASSSLHARQCHPPRSSQFSSSQVGGPGLHSPELLEGLLRVAKPILIARGREVVFEALTRVSGSGQAH